MFVGLVRSRCACLIRGRAARWRLSSQSRRPCSTALKCAGGQDRLPTHVVAPGAGGRVAARDAADLGPACDAGARTCSRASAHCVPAHVDGPCGDADGARGKPATGAATPCAWAGLRLLRVAGRRHSVCRVVTHRRRRAGDATRRATTGIDAGRCDGCRWPRRPRPATRGLIGTRGRAQRALDMTHWPSIPHRGRWAGQSLV